MKKKRQIAPVLWFLGQCIVAGPIGGDRGDE